MRNIQRLIYIYLPLVFVLSSCYEDLGNYDYTEINEVTIKGLEDSYELQVGDNLEITPDLSYTLDENADPKDYEFEWYVINNLGVDSERYSTIGSEMDLVYPVKLKPGTYEGHYKITDKETGVFFKASFDLKVNSVVSEGWMVLGEVDGQARLDMAPWIDGEYQVIRDILSFTGSELELEGEPEYLFTMLIKSGLYGVYVTTSETGTTRIDQDDFSWDNTYRLSFEMTANVPLNFKADAMYRNFDWRNGRTQYSSYIVADGDVYFYYSKYNLNYSAPLNIMANESIPFKASKYMSTGWQDIAAPIIYDEDNRRFVRHLTENRASDVVAANATGGLFDANDLQMDLVWMGYSNYNQGEAVSVLKDDTGKYFIAKIWQKNRQVRELYFEEVSVPGFENAENFCMQHQLGYMFFNIGNKVYEYDLNTKVAHEMLDLGDKEVTLLKFNEMEASGVNTKDIPNQLLVAVNDPTLPSGESGYFELYDVPTVNGQITLADHFEGFAKIKSVVYKER